MATFLRGYHIVSTSLRPPLAGAREIRPVLLGRHPPRMVWSYSYRA